MDTRLPRIAEAEVTGPSAVRISWDDGSQDVVDLTGWVATGGPVLERLREPGYFRDAFVGENGAALEWPLDEDLAIDAHHLRLLALAQRPFGASDIAAWQEAMNLSNQEAADFFQTALSTWNSYKAGAAIPIRIAMLCRAAERDPILMQAYYRPRKAGRPKREKAPA